MSMKQASVSKSGIKKKVVTSHNKTMIEQVASNKNILGVQKGEIGLRCGRCGAGPLILMNGDNERLYTESEVKTLNKELEHEVNMLNQIRDQQTASIQKRETEIS